MWKKLSYRIRYAAAGEMLFGIPNKTHSISRTRKSTSRAGKEKKKRTQAVITQDIEKRNLQYSIAM